MFLIGCRRWSPLRSFGQLKWKYFFDLLWSIRPEPRDLDQQRTIWIAFLRISCSSKKVLALALNFGPHSEPIHQTSSITQRSFAIDCTYHKGYLSLLLLLIFAFQQILLGYPFPIYLEIDRCRCIECFTLHHPSGLISVLKFDLLNLYQNLKIELCYQAS